MKNRFIVYVPGSQSFVKIYVIQLDETEVVKYRLLGRKVRVRSLGSRLVARSCMVNECHRWGRRMGGIRRSTYRFELNHAEALEIVHQLNDGTSTANLSWVERKKGKRND